jgi:hypothetical protein
MACKGAMITENGVLDIYNHQQVTFGLVFEYDRVHIKSHKKYINNLMLKIQLKATIHLNPTYSPYLSYFLGL